MLDERHERFGLTAENLEAVVGAAIVEPHDEGPEGIAPGVDGHRRRVLTVDPDVTDVGGNRRRGRKDFPDALDDGLPDLTRVLLRPIGRRAWS